MASTCALVVDLSGGAGVAQERGHQRLLRMAMLLDGRRRAARSHDDSTTTVCTVLCASLIICLDFRSNAQSGATCLSGPRHLCACSVALMYMLHA